MKTSTSNWLGVAHRATAQAEVAFDTPAELIEGHFEATVDPQAMLLRVAVPEVWRPSGAGGLRSALSPRRRLGPDPQWAAPYLEPHPAKGGRLSGSRSPCSSTPELGHYPRGG